MINELVTLVRLFLWWLLALGFFAVVFFVPLMGGHSVVVMIFERLVVDLLPPGVTLVVTSPWQAFVAQVGLAFGVAFLLSFPLLLWGTMRYLSPALHQFEQRALVRVLLPATALFIGGCAFAYAYIVPATISVLYTFVGDLSATPLLIVSEFVYLVFALLLVTGVLFLLPVVMVLLSTLGLVPANFWFAHWRIALATGLMFSAIITPDGSGVTMLLLALPLSGLYVIGGFVTRVRGQGGINRKLS